MVLLPQAAVILGYTGHVIGVCLQLRQLTHLGVDLEMREMLLDSLLLLPLHLDQVMHSPLSLPPFCLLPFICCSFVSH